ncbi:cholinesterase precursor [Plenodomus tracheiphilus IPT5]|uniref:Carboxylic ester hydrolase n=1 Tax=Plenodomus tracheiphilus IPT5 TaxID=1408161 RepID=A0A6A7BHI1_9PLEO|nr:cholinesterase precursor [Plenodomus tracheiphilus IPT5]
MHRLLVVAAAAASFSGSTIAVSPSPNGVQTSSGTIFGHQAANRPRVTEFLGIRYAEAPVGDLRFAAPKKFEAPAGTIFEASEWSADCPSNKPPISAFPNFTEPSGLRVWKNFVAQNSNPASEDCLKLNVWSRDPENVKTKKPVLVFFHGGRFQIPGPHSPFYNGQYLADAEDVVVVTPSYRLGIFGFAGAPGIEANAALRDQRAAVEWVRDNIAKFGGDPSRIVIVGQSAGGSSVDYWSFAWKSDPIVSGLIPMSGTSLSFLPNTQEYSQSLWYNVSQTVGCGGPNDDSAVVLSCVRSKNTSSLLAAAARVPALPTQALSQATFHPTVDNITVFANYEQLSAAGAFAKIPLLVGNADQEDGWYRITGWGAKLNFTDARWKLFAQSAFSCPVAHSARYRVQYGVPTFRYRYHGDWDNLRLYNGSAGLSPRGSAAYHGSDLNMVFGTAEDVSGLKNTGAEDEAIKYIQGAWAAFVRDPKSGLTKYGWPAYSETGKTIVELAVNNSPTPRFVDPATYDASCPAVNDPLPGRGAF